MGRDTTRDQATAASRNEGVARANRGPPYNGMVIVNVLLFASIAEKAGRRKVVMDLRPGDTVASVRDRLFAEFPQLQPFAPTLLYALDEEYARETAAVHDGATLALIPPVSGG